ncbi:B12-binding domain-containing radical SAM protein [Actinoallomurus sp. CA-150999]|uniref:B12-binding domain-containing radical SAM protein n=1 Tax=Actinoallomurus sp. CA-150999 TaxID=3239887 RepID=UPI003D948545
MRVALLYPEVYDMARFKEARKEFPPFGVLYLAAVIEQAGHEAVIEAVTPTRTTLDLTGFDAVGFSLASSATYRLMLTARKTSVFAPDCLVMVGGVHANFYPTESLVDFDAHVVADGESEEIILDLLHRSADFGRDFTGIPGIYWRDATGQIIQGPPRALMRNIDELPLPARHLLPRQNVVMSDRLAGTDTEMAHVMFSRGCPFPCAFCAAAQSRIQYRGAASARRELEHLINAYGIEGFAIVDDNFIVHKGKVAAICDEIADLGLRWSALSRVDTVDAPLLKKMAAAGCIEIKYGMESGNEPLLKAMRKNTRRTQISNAVRMTADAGIGAKVFVIHGFPGENDATTDETISLLEELAPHLARVALFRFVPLPGTQVYADPDRYQITGTHLQPGWDGDWSRFHIHHNTRRWWGTDEQWAEVESSYARLRAFVEATWGPQS